MSDDRAGCETPAALVDALTIGNAQLRTKVAGLEARLAELTHLLTSSQIATLCLDCDTRIRWLSPNMETIGRMKAGDVGRPLTDFLGANLGADIVADAARVLETLQPIQRELSLADDRWHLRRIVPLRSDNDHIGGVVITYADITEAKRSAQAAVAA